MKIKYVQIKKYFVWDLVKNTYIHIYVCIHIYVYIYNSRDELTSWQSCLPIHEYNGPNFYFPFLTVQIDFEEVHTLHLLYVFLDK